MENNWKKERAGKFTASEIHRLMVSGRTKGQLFGAGAMTYIREVTAECLTGEPIETKETEAMAWGKKWEPSAILAFEEKFGFKTTSYGGENPKFFEHPLYKFAGGSPDAEGENFCTEAKCPFNPANHVDFLQASLLIDQDQWLKKEHFDYWCQLQFNMIIRKKEKGYLISYDPRMIKDENKLATISVDACPEFKADVESRLNEAKKIIAAIINQLNK